MTSPSCAVGSSLPRGFPTCVTGTLSEPQRCISLYARSSDWTLFLKRQPVSDPSSLLFRQGKLDCIIKTEHSLMLADKCSDARIEYHPGGEQSYASPSSKNCTDPQKSPRPSVLARSGHFVPVQPRWRTFFRDYIFSFREGGSMGDLPPLTPSPLSTPSTSPVLNKSLRFASRSRKEARTVTSLQQPACT